MNTPLPPAAQALIIIKMKTTRELLTAADKLIAHSTLPRENRAIIAHYAFSRALCICTHKIYKSKSTIPHPDQISAVALIPFFHNALILTSPEKSKINMDTILDKFLIMSPSK